jgi:linoleoyl-CoA desaturase
MQKLVKFGRESAFATSLQQGADAYFARTPLPERDVPQMYRKTALIWAWFIASWAVLVLAPGAWWLKIPAAVSLGLAIAGIGMGVMHDANHGAYSRTPWLNRWIGYSIDCMGASSFVWRTKHNKLHHTWTNIGGLDDDLELGMLSRMSPHQKWLPMHRVQHLYMWVLYGLLVPKWVLFDDFHNIYTGRVGPLPLPKLSTRDWTVLLTGKVLHIGLGLVVPLLLYPWYFALPLYFLVNAVAGVTLATTFQMAHCVDTAEMVTMPEDGRLSDDWASHQLKTTVDFAPKNKLLSWYVGGLNFQVVHHLFPKVCHIHYPALSRIVESTAREHGLTYRVQPTLLGSIASHYCWLRQMGVRPAVA